MNRLRRIFFVIITVVFLTGITMTTSTQPPSDDPAPIQLPEDFRGFGNAEPLVGEDQSQQSSFSLEEENLDTSEARFYPSCGRYNDLPLSECNALLALYYSTDGQNWNTYARGWNGFTATCRWYGVICEQTGVSREMHVVSISLPNNNLAGAIPPQIIDLPYLRKLELAQNSITTLPSEIFFLDQLVNIDLSGNQFQGFTPLLDEPPIPLPYPITSYSNLTWFDLSNNQMSHIPAEVLKLGKLYYLDLSSNQLTTLSADIDNLTKLNYLYLQHNKFTSLPVEIGNLPLLWFLDLSYNQLTALPSTLSNLTALIGIDLSHNRLDSIPTINVLNWIDLSYNKLTVPRVSPWSLSGSAIHTINLSNNLLNTIPNLNTPSLNMLDLSNNRLNNLTTQMGYYSELLNLNLSGNMLTGIAELLPLQSYGYLQDGSINLDYNMLNLSGASATFANSYASGYINTQTIPPRNFRADTSTTYTDGIVKLRWDPIPYTYHVGIYEIFCSTVTGVSESNYDFKIITPDKYTPNVTLSGLPIDTYWCAIRSTTNAHKNNQNTLVSPLSAEKRFDITNDVPPVNDNFANATTIDHMPFLYFTTKLANATLEAGAPLPSCANLNLENARSIYFRLDNGGPINPNLYNEKESEFRGSRSIFNTRAESNTRTTMAAYTGNTLATLSEQECKTFDNFNGTALDILASDNADYTIIVWADEPTDGGAGGSDESYSQDTTQGTFDFVKECNLITTIPSKDCNALLDIYGALGGRHWRSTTTLRDNTWMRYNDPCQWAGVTCDIGRVTALDLSGQGLVGILPESIGDLDALIRLDLSGNRLSGNLPSAFTAETFPQLIDLDLDYNMLNRPPPNGAIDTFLRDQNQGYTWYTQTISPVITRTTAVSGNAVNVSWEPIQYRWDSGYYNVGYSKSPTGPFIIAGSTEDKEYNAMLVDGLDPDTQYYFVVRTVTQPHIHNSFELTSAFSSVVSQVTLSGNILTPPTNLTATTEGAKHIRLTWANVPASANSLMIERAEGDQTAVLQQLQNGLETRIIWKKIDTVFSSTRFYDDIDLTMDASKVYTYRIRAYRSDDQVYSAYSNMSVAKATNVLGALSNLSAATIAPKHIKLKWTGNPSDATSIHIERKISSTNNWGKIGHVSGSATEYNDQSANLDPNKTYSYRVRVYRDIDDQYSAYSNIASAKGTTVLSAPSALTASASGTKLVQLSWTNHATDANNLRIERKINGTTNWQQIALIAPSNTSYNDATALPSTAYVYRVRVYRQIDNAYSSYSNTANARTADLLVAGGFEGEKVGGIPIGWEGSKTSNPGKDKQKCDKPELNKYVAHTGSCAFMFKGNKDGSKSKIKQTAPSLESFTDGTTVTLSVFVDNRSAPANKVFSKFLILYSDGFKDKLRLRLPDSSGYQKVSGSLKVDLSGGRTIENVKVDFRWAGSSGKFFIDDVLMTFAPPISLIRIEDLLPLPDAPASFRD